MEVGHLPPCQDLAALVSQQGACFEEERKVGI